MRRGPNEHLPTKVLLATDGSKDAERAATTAADLAEKTSSELRIVTVAEDPYLATDYTIHFPEAAERHRQEVREEVQAMLDGQVERVREAGGKVAKAHLKVGRADDEIVSLAEEGDTGLVVMGSRGAKAGSGGRAWVASRVASSTTPTAPCWWCASKAALEGLTHPPLFTEVPRETVKKQVEAAANPDGWHHADGCSMIG